MRKKITLRLFLLTAFLAVVWSCQQELMQAGQEYDAQLQKNTVEWLSRAQLEKNHPQVLDKINRISPNNTSESKGIYTDAENGFSIDTDEAYLVKDANGTITYTFKVERGPEKDESVLENLILKDTGEGNFFAYFITYDAAALSNSREKPLSSEELSHHISLYTVGKKTSAEIFGKLNSCPVTFYPVGTYVYVPGHQCIEGLHDYGEPCAYLGTSNAATQGGYEVVYNITVQETPGSCGGSGSGGGMGTTPVSGGGGNINLPELNDPCEKTKNLMQKQEVKDVVNDLKNHLNSGTGGEKGWRLNKSGPPTPTTENSAHSVNFGDPSTMNGGYHNHTGTKVDMFSANDIDTLLEIVRYQDIGYTENGFLGMVAPNGIHYVIYFIGNHTDLPPSGTFSETDLEILKIKQYRNQIRLLSDTSGTYCNVQTGKLNSKGLEKIFMDSLKAMGLSNKVILQRIDNDGIKTIKQNNDGTIDAVPCV